jgi:hypothetical protein
MEGTKTEYYQISELANLLETTHRTVRCYEEIGLLNSKGRYFELPEKDTSEAKHQKRPSERRGLA